MEREGTHLVEIYDGYTQNSDSSDSRSYTLARGAKYETSIKGRHCDRNGAGTGAPPTKDTARYTALVEDASGGNPSSGTGIKGKSLYIKDDQNLLGSNKKFEDSVLSKKATVFLPKLTLKELGFKDDEIITQWSDEKKIDPNQNEPVWEQGSESKPICYIKDKSPKAFVKIQVDPGDMPQTTFSLKVKLNGTEMGVWNGLTLKGEELKLEDLIFNKPLANDVDVIDDPLEWEWSLDPNKGWNKLASTQNTFYIVHAKPFQGENAPLYDLGLKYACEFRKKRKHKTIAEAICEGVEETRRYDGSARKDTVMLPNGQVNLQPPKKNIILN
ncbi:MAG: hypothetical protein NZM04_07885 [Methylacidiphilales bacterium]|nr:hypothetical protein [Candidatus Methylacidiphilales bacterium]